MAKSKEQKQKEAIERKARAFFETALLPFVKRMPGGEFFDASENGISRLFEAFDKAKKIAQEAKLSIEGKSSSYCSDWEWPTETCIRWYTARNNWMDALFKMQVNFNEVIGNGEVPFQVNIDRIDSDMIKLIIALGPEK